MSSNTFCTRISFHQQINTSDKDFTLKCKIYEYIYIIKSDVCLSVCQHSNVRTLTSPPILKLWDTQGYLWLPYDLTEVIKLFGVTFKQKNFFFFKKILYVIPSALLSFLRYYCHSFRITVIPSVLLSFLPNIAIPS